MRKSTEAIITAAIVVGLISVGGSASAYWVGGDSTGSSAAGIAPNDSGLVVTQAQPVTGLYPNGPAIDIATTVTNQKDIAATISGMTATIHSILAPDGSKAVGCDPDDFTLLDADFTPFDLAANTTVSPPEHLGVKILMDKSGADQSACSRATVTIDFVLR